MNGTASRGGRNAVTMELSGGPQAAAAARELVSELVGDVTPPEAMHDVLLLTTELITNAVKHADVDESSTLRLQVEARGDVRRVTVIDPGGPTRPRMQDVDVSVPGGMGLFLVDALSSRWGSETEGIGTRVWFELAV
jgi:anti-sigma regulatory factor (Ser/Thr protein kinase)